MAIHLHFLMETLKEILKLTDFQKEIRMRFQKEIRMRFPMVILRSTGFLIGFPKETRMAIRWPTQKGFLMPTRMVILKLTDFLTAIHWLIQMVTRKGFPREIRISMEIQMVTHSRFLMATLMPILTGSQMDSLMVIR